MDYMDFSENKILRVTPGKLTNYMSSTWDGISSNVMKSFASTTSHSSHVIPARIKLYVSQLRLSKKCMHHIQQQFPENVYMKLKWTFFNFQETITSPEKLDSNNKAKFDFTTKYDLEVEDNFLQKLNENPIYFYMYAVSKGQEIFLSQQQFFIENILEYVNAKKDAKISFSSDLVDTSAETIGSLDIWYKFSCKQKSIKTLFSQSTPTAIKRYKSLAKLSDILDEKVFHKGKGLGSVHVTDSETDHFADGLLLVLNRNKVLKTTQSDISTELDERVRWLRFEANWKQTLQENAILHGKDPKEVQWRQWREEDTANVRLRTYHNLKPKTYDPNLSITVVKLIFFEASSPIRNPTIEKIYVEYSFLNFEGPEMETPYSLPKPQPNKPIFFNFKRTFNIDIKKHSERCHLLADLIKNDKKIKFMVISEPVENLETPIQTCYDIGYVELPLNELIQLEENVDEFDYEIIDIKNPIAVVGYLTIKVEGILAMRKTVLDILAPHDYDLYM